MYGIYTQFSKLPYDLLIISCNFYAWRPALFGFHQLFNNSCKTVDATRIKFSFIIVWLLETRTNSCRISLETQQCFSKFSYFKILITSKCHSHKMLVHIFLLPSMPISVSINSTKINISQNTPKVDITTSLPLIKVTIKWELSQLPIFLSFYRVRTGNT